MWLAYFGYSTNNIFRSNKYFVEHRENEEDFLNRKYCGLQSS